jgi:hypothetical protein
METRVLSQPQPRRRIVFSAIVRADELNGLGEILNTDTIRWYRAAHNDQLPCDIFAIHTYGSNQDPASPQYTYDQCAGCPAGTGGFEHSLDLMLGAKTRWNPNSPLVPSDKIYLTEVGFDANKGGGEQRQAAAARYAFEKLRNHRFARIKKAFHYNFRDDEATPCTPGERSAAVIAAGMFDYWMAKGGGPAVGFPCQNGGGWDAHLWEAGPYTAKLQDLRKTQNGEKALMMRDMVPGSPPSVYLVSGDNLHAVHGRRARPRLLRPGAKRSRRGRRRQAFADFRQRNDHHGAVAPPLSEESHALKKLTALHQRAVSFSVQRAATPRAVPVEAALPSGAPENYNRAPPCPRVRLSRVTSRAPSPSA